MKREYNAVLLQFARPKDRTLNVAVTDQGKIKRSSEPKTSNNLPFSDQPWHPLPAPPAWAPTQTAFVTAKPQDNNHENVAIEACVSVKIGIGMQRICCNRGLCFCENGHRNAEDMDHAL